MWPQYVYLGLVCTGLGVVLANFGRPVKRTYGDPVTWVALGIQVTLLYFGGFFKGM